MSEILTSIGALVIGTPIIMGIILAGITWRAWWLYPAWAWFIVPLGAPSINFWHFAALLLLLDTMKTISVKKDERKTEWGSIVVIILWPIAAWALLRWMR
jgi:hypothetical protein